VKVTEIMSRPVITVSPETQVKEAARLLVERGISALPVLDVRGALVGIVSEADLMSMQERPDPRGQATPLPPSAGSSPASVAEVMTRHVLTLQVGSEVSQAVRAMLEAGVKRMPVMRGKQLVGIVSRRDLMRVIARPDESLRERQPSAARPPRPSLTGAQSPDHKGRSARRSVSRGADRP
jgi:CBS domain-containing protein